MKKSDRQIKMEATKKEHARVFENMNLPCRTIYAECSDGEWKREPCRYGNLEWSKWEKLR